MDFDQYAATNKSDNLETILEERLSRRLRMTGQEAWLALRDDLYAIPYVDGYLLYAPLRGINCLVTRRGLASLLLDEESPVGTILTDCMFEEDRALLARLDDPPSKRVEIAVKAGDFRPARLTLSPTSACQLACIYCYIAGGDRPRHMPWEVAAAALQYTIANAAELKQDEYCLDFHGEGEPTANWSLLTRAVAMAEELCAVKGIQPRLSLVTNGIISQEQIDFLAAHRFNIGLSLDGSQATMDYQRPMRGGGSSFEHVHRTMKAFEKAGLAYAVRATVTSHCAGKMGELVELLAGSSGCRQIQMEPACVAGRGAGSGCEAEIAGEGLMEEFLAAFSHARDEGLRKQIAVEHSFCRIEGIRSNFCAASGPNLNFCVSTGGWVSSCYEVLVPDDPRAEMFMYGRYDPGSRSFVLNEERLQFLLDLNVNSYKRCQDCYARWNCAGDCPAKAALDGLENLTDAVDRERCILGRGAAKNELFRSLFKIDKSLAREVEAGSGVIRV